jgi:TPR repeat protein
MASPWRRNFGPILAIACVCLACAPERRLEVAAPDLRCVEVSDCEQLCNMGQAKACRSLAELFASSAVTERDELRALRMYQHACAAGDNASCVAAAQRMLGGPSTIAVPELH